MLFPFSPWGIDPVGVAVQLGVGVGAPAQTPPAGPLDGRSGERGAAVPRGTKSL